VPSNPRVGKFPQTAEITWSDDSLFTGILYVALVPPEYSENDDATSVDYQAFYPGQKIPTRVGIPIVNGLFNNSLGLFYNEDLSPPNSRYACRLYDITGRAVTSMSSLFEVNSDPIDSLPSLSPTAPAVGDTIPQPN